MPTASTRNSRTPAARWTTGDPQPRPGRTGVQASSRKPRPHRLDAARRAAEIAKEENAYFTQTRRKAEEETADQELERRKQLLSNQQEELRQLTKMYEADDLTEDTEEIILTRQKDDVASAEFALRMETLDHKRTLEVILPREAVTLANNERDTAIALRQRRGGNAPRDRTQENRTRNAQDHPRTRDKESLANLEQDRTLFEFKAPADGWFYHGPIENGRWITGDAVKSPRHPRPPARQPALRHLHSRHRQARPRRLPR